VDPTGPIDPTARTGGLTFRRSELLLAVAAMAGVLVIDILYGILLRHSNADG
jgi:hypothetical protein